MQNNNSLYKYQKYKKKYLLQLQRGGTNTAITDLLEPTVLKFVEELDKNNGPPIYTLSPKDAREVLDKLQESYISNIPVDIVDIQIPDKYNTSVRIMRPKNNNNKLPVVIYFHGGGWILGNKNTHNRLISEITIGSDAAVAFVNYNLSPESKFPVAIEQAYAVTNYIYENASQFNLDSTRLVVMGDSVGGNMATVVTILAKERNGPPIKQQILFYPVTDAKMDTKSYQKYASGPWLSKVSMEWFWNAYEPDVSKRNNYLLSPLQASLDQLSGLPPALIITDENDVLRDEGEAYAHRLMKAGVDVVAVRYLGTIHDFVMLSPLRDSQATRSAINLAISVLKKNFTNK